jgi:hypothetical protein
MAGHGSRFKESGYRSPKFRIMAHGRTLMDWSLSSLRAFFDERFIFACLDEEDGDWISAMAAAAGIGEVVVAKRASVSRGQAETAFDALAHVDADQPLWIFNIDTRVAPDAMRPHDLGAAAGCIPVFPCAEPSMSFVRYGSDDDVIEIAEKRAISSWATVGLYGFRSAASFAEHYQEAYERGRIRIVQGERYVAPMFELMLLKGERLIAPRLKAEDVSILGTPAQILAFDPGAQPPYGNTIAMR